MISDNHPIPRLCISIQPQPRGHRFRYLTEKLEHGHLLGDREGMKAYPTISIQNCPPSACIYIHVSLCVEESDQVHMHNLHGKNVFNGQYLVKLQAGIDGCLTCPLEGISICRTKKSSKHEMLCCKLAQKVLLKENGIDHYMELMKGCVELNSEFKVSWFENNFPNMNSLLGEAGCICAANNAVRLNCQVFVFIDEKQYKYIHLQDISRTVFNKQCAACATLMIREISHVSGSTNGEKVILLCDIVEKDDIEIAFFTLNDHFIGMGNFSQLNVWHQHSIVFTTPPCKSNVAVQAKLCLCRKSNPNDRSNFFPFTFNPPFSYPTYTEQDLLMDPRLDIQPQLPYYPPPYQQPPQNPYP